MYKSLLIFKYLRKRRIAWVSLIAVMLCTAMVLIVISVMGGWLEMFKAKFRGMSGDIVVYRSSLSGFGGYEQMLEQIRALPDVDAALPLVRTFGLINIDNQIIEGVQITGLDVTAFTRPNKDGQRFNSFRESLWRQYQKPVQDGQKPPATASFDLLPDIDYSAYRPNDPQAANRPGIIVGGPLVGMKKDSSGHTVDVPGLYYHWARLEVVPVSSDFRTLRDVTPSSNIYWIVDASQTQLYQLDANSVYVPFEVLQKDLQMTEQTYTENIQGKDVQMTQPARCSEIQIKIKPGANRDKVIGDVGKIVYDISDKLQPGLFPPVRVEPWEQQQAKFLGAVEHEKTLVTFLFGLISIVAIFLVFCILYMIVVEKTRDIGILKSVGATSQGVAGIFLGYGFAIGVVGGAAGLGLAWVIVHWINQIHDTMAHVLGVKIWDPETYAFDKIPNTVDPPTAAVIFGVAILSAVLGAVVPAMRAARLNPVEALRFE